MKEDLNDDLKNIKSDLQLLGDNFLKLDNKLKEVNDRIKRLEFRIWGIIIVEVLFYIIDGFRKH